MPETRYLYLLFLLISTILYAQDPDELYRLYAQKKTGEIKQIIDAIPDDRPEIRFYRYLFIENGDEAVGLYEALFPQTSGRTKKMVAGKIAEYYYAKGYYVKAEEYFAYAELPADKPAPVAQQPQKIYYIQVGAFGYRDNADRMKELLQQRNINSTVEKREVNGNILYCVWIAGTEDPEQTRKLAEDLKQKHKLSYQIINP